VFDAGATGIPNLDLLVSDKMKYLSRMKLNTSDITQHLNTFSKEEWTPIMTGNPMNRCTGRNWCSPAGPNTYNSPKTMYDDPC
jgi:hypothetical protein